MERPNVLLIVLDAVRRDHLSCYGHDRPTTPTVDALSEEGVRYDHAVAPAPWTAPSHASMFTGLYPTHHRVFGSQPQLGADHSVVAEALRAAGYTTLGFSNSFFTGVEHGFSRGFDVYHDLPSLPRPAWTGGHMFEPSLPYAKFLARYFLTGDDVSYFQTEKLQSKLRSTSTPFFAFINVRAAHNPYAPPKRFKEPFEASFDRWDEVDESVAAAVATGDGGERYMVGELDVGDAEWDLIGRWYDAELRYADALLDDVFETLRRMGRYDETLVVVTADHGEHLGEDGLLGHNFSLSEHLIHVPLIVKWPEGGPAGAPNELVSLTDLAPTFADVAGTSMGDADGRSLVSDPEPDVVFAEYEGCYLPWRKRLAADYGHQFPRYDDRFQVARTTDRKLVLENGEPTLYRVDDGPAETPVDDPRTESWLHDELAATLGTFPDVEGVPNPSSLSSHVEGHLRELGYL